MKTPQIDEDKWVKDFVALIKPQCPPDKTDEELEEFAREMFAEARRRGEAMSKVHDDLPPYKNHPSTHYAVDDPNSPRYDE